MLIAKNFNNIDNGLRTHTRYVRNISLGLSDDLFFNLYNKKYLDFAPKENEQIGKKVGIISHTLRTMKEEHDIAKKDEEFRNLTTSWLWIKGYYCFFHLFSIIISYEKKDSRYVLDKKYNAHSKILNLINEILVQKPFNVQYLNNFYLGGELEKFATKDHENLKNISIFNENLYKLSVKKSFKYDGSKIKEKRQKKYSFFNLAISYREKFNYQGFSYLELNDPLNDAELNKFYESSYNIIYFINKSLITFLADNTTGDIKRKLKTIIV